MVLASFYDASNLAFPEVIQLRVRTNSFEDDRAQNFERFAQ